MVSIKSKALAAAAVAVFGITSISTNALAQTVTQNASATVNVIDAITMNITGSIDFGTLFAVSSDDGTADFASLILEPDGTYGTNTPGVANATITTVGNAGAVPTFTVGSAAGVDITIGAPTTPIAMECSGGPSCTTIQIFEVVDFVALGGTVTLGGTPAAGSGVANTVEANGATFQTLAPDDTFTIGATLRTASGLNLDALPSTTAAYGADTYSTTNASTNIPITISF